MNKVLSHQATWRTDNLDTSAKIKTTLQWLWEELVPVINRKWNFPETFTVATLPDPTRSKPGTVIYVSDGAAGAKLRYTDGTTWNNLG